MTTTMLGASYFSSILTDVLFALLLSGLVHARLSVDGGKRIVTDSLQHNGTLQMITVEPDLSLPIPNLTKHSEPLARCLLRLSRTVLRGSVQG